MPPTSNYSVTLADNTKKKNGQGGETTNFHVRTVNLTPANVAAQQLLAAAFLTAVSDITLGFTARTALTYADVDFGAVRPTDTRAQRENKWLCRYHDVTSLANFTVSIGTADLGDLPDGSEFLDLVGGDGLAFKDAFEDFVRSPDDDTHLVILDSVQFVGRNT